MCTHSHDGVCIKFIFSSLPQIPLQLALAVNMTQPGVREELLIRGLESRISMRLACAHVCGGIFLVDN